MSDLVGMYILGLASGWLSAGAALAFLGRHEPEGDVKIVRAGDRHYALVEIVAPE